MAWNMTAITRTKSITTNNGWEVVSMSALKSPELMDAVDRNDRCMNTYTTRTSPVMRWPTHAHMPVFIFVGQNSEFLPNNHFRPLIFIQTPIPDYSSSLGGSRVRHACEVSGLRAARPLDWQNCT